MSQNGRAQAEQDRPGLAQALARYRDDLAPRVLAAVAAAAAVSPGFARRLGQAGLAASDLRQLSDLDRLPVLSKDDLIGAQRLDPPFGGMLGPDARVERIFQSPGPLYEPQLAGPDPWRWRPALAAAGFGPGDRVLNCFGYHLSPAGAMFELGALAVGATVVPAGIGNQDLQAAAVADAGVSAYTGLPSYLKAVIDRYDAAGLPPERWGLVKAVVTAEPLPDSLRAQLCRRVPTVLMAYGTAEAGLLGYETEPGGGLVPGPELLIEVCGLADGQPLTDGEGEVVVTLLRPEYPLVRFGTGDLSAWVLGPDGRPRLAGVLGRVGQAVKVRGMFLHPRQAAAVLDGVPGLAGWRLVVDRRDHRDELRAEIAVTPGSDGESVAREVAQRIRSGLRFNAEVGVRPTLETQGDLTDLRTW